MESRRAPRARVALEVALMRRHGSPVLGHTEDVGTGGARVVVDRPLQIDEELRFDLVCAQGHVDGHCRVVRQQGVNRYAVRFERLEAAASAVLADVVGRTQ